MKKFKKSIVISSLHTHTLIIDTIYTCTTKPFITIKYKKKPFTYHTYDSRKRSYNKLRKWKKSSYIFWTANKIPALSCPIPSVDKKKCIYNVIKWFMIMSPSRVFIQFMSSNKNKNRFRQRIYFFQFFCIFTKYSLYLYTIYRHIYFIPFGFIYSYQVTLIYL